MSLETSFDPSFTAALALREKQIQQNYRPVIGVHKWFARRPGTLFRNLMLAEFNGDEPPSSAFFRAHAFQGVIGDPFMGGGTPLLEANSLGFHVLGTDINPMAWWIVRQEIGPFDDDAFVREAGRVASEVAATIDPLYSTECLKCHGAATVKYFLWVKQMDCPSCGLANDLFPGYLLAENSRHPQHVLACSECLGLVELDHQPRSDAPVRCPHCAGAVQIDGPARNKQITCRGCSTVFRYPSGLGVPRHRLWAIEYHCPACKPTHEGRFFKSPGAADRQRFDDAARLLVSIEGELLIPDDEIPAGDETNRLHRWGYRRYREMFNERQLLGLGLLQRSILATSDRNVRHALLTVFSDSLRYQNMLCRYDTYALKCQDIFSVHGFPVGLVQCENNLLGIPKVGSGSFRHFVEKYRKAKAYCAKPFETLQRGRGKKLIPVRGETIEAELVSTVPSGPRRQALLVRGSSADIELPPASLDGVFTDPPYFANVQYAELMDFCYVWLRRSLSGEFAEFAPGSTRAANELTGNETLGRDLAHFTKGLSDVFRRFASALKPGAPFVFTYHHNRIEAYAPLVVALLDARLHCGAVLPAPAEMSASLHINNTASSILDSVFVCRQESPLITVLPTVQQIRDLLIDDLRNMAAGGVRVTLGDARCLLSGHLAGLAVERLHARWDAMAELSARIGSVQRVLQELSRECERLAVRWLRYKRCAGCEAK